jgi:UrcA family protein
MKAQFAALAALAAGWQPVSALPRAQATSQTVSHGDLDLASPEDRRVLDARLAAAAEQVCRIDEERSPLDWIGGVRCVRATLDAARRDALRVLRSSRQPRVAQSGR